MFNLLFLLLSFDFWEFISLAIRVARGVTVATVKSTTTNKGKLLLTTIVLGLTWVSKGGTAVLNNE